MPAFIFKTGGNWQTVKMSESISQSLTSTETSEVCDAGKSERHLVCVGGARATVSLFSCLFACFKETEGGKWGDNFLACFFFKIAGEDADSNQLCYPSENNVRGIVPFL